MAGARLEALPNGVGRTFLICGAVILSGCSTLPRMSSDVSPHVNVGEVAFAAACDLHHDLLAQPLLPDNACTTA